MPGGGTSYKPDDVSQEHKEADYDESLPDKIISWLDDAEEQGNAKRVIPIATMCEKECKLAKCEATIEELLMRLTSYEGEMSADAEILDCISRLKKLIEP